MKGKLKFYDSAALFIVSMVVLWGCTIPMIICLIVAKKYDDFFYWLLCGILTFCTPLVTIVSYVRMMSKIYLDENGITKKLFSQKRKQFINWENIEDCQMVTRPNGYLYLVISDEKINKESFNECLKDKAHCICFTYNEKALEFIKRHVNKELLNN